MILVTGATGTVGSEVVKRLSAQGIQARAVTRDLHKVEANRFHMFNLSKAILMTPIRCGARARAWSVLSC